MLVLADALATKYGKRVVWFSYEMRAASVKDRARYLDLHRNPNNLIITGNITLDMIEEYCNEDTIVVVDYLDLGISTVNEGLRFALIAAYQRALQLSKKSFCFITASQVNKGILSVSSGNESAAKAHYPELILGIAKQGSSLLNKGYSTVELSVLKNRYGVSDAQTTFELDYKTLQYKEYSRGGTVVYDEEALLQLGGV
jgi:hypothetical protein